VTQIKHDTQARIQDFLLVGRGPRTFFGGNKKV